jgi:hypothetical protein
VRLLSRLKSSAEDLHAHVRSVSQCLACSHLFSMSLFCHSRRPHRLPTSAIMVVRPLVLVYPATWLNQLPRQCFQHLPYAKLKEMMGPGLWLYTAELHSPLRGETGVASQAFRPGSCRRGYKYSSPASPETGVRSELRRLAMR